ncbi:CotH kinase family protein [Wenyingzhuangia sp. IMCC45533]
MIRLCTLMAFYFFLLQSCHKTEVIFDNEVDRNLELTPILVINDKNCSYDHQTKTLSYPISDTSINQFSPKIEFQNIAEVFFNGNKLINGENYNLGNIDVNNKIPFTIKARETTEQFFLRFTSLPIIQIATANTIVDEPKNLAKLTINHTDANQNLEEYFIGIEFRGNFSQSFDKKSFGFALFQNPSLDTEVSESLFDIPKNNDWILNAMWVDKSRSRNKTSFELWNKLSKPKYRAIKGKYVEVFVNNNRRGLYCLSNNLNAETLVMTTNSEFLYKGFDWGDGGTRFEKLKSKPPFNIIWDGWEQLSPNPKERIDWTPINQARNLIVNTTDTELQAQASNLLDIEHFVDFYLFINLMSALDNTGKNTFMAKKGATDKLHYIPWDLDATWGSTYDGRRYGHTDIISNNLFDRLIATNSGNFRTKLKSRWNELRNNIFSETELLSLFNQNFEIIKQSDVITVENKRWGANLNISDEQNFLTDWVKLRLTFLDTHFDNLAP